MEKLTLTDVTRRTAGGYIIGRKCEHNVDIGYNGVGNILTYTLVSTLTDINSAVLEMMTMAAQDVLDLSKPMFKGNFTAKELAGKVSGFSPMVFPFTNEHYVGYQRIFIECGTFKCHYDAKDVFLMLSEWESMMGISQNKTHRFPCDAEKEMPKDISFKPYKCCRGYRPKRPSIYDMDQERIAKKYAVLGPLSQSLTDDGMRKGMSALAAINSIGKLYGKETKDLARKAISRWIWDEHRRDDSARLVELSDKAFDYAPDCWRVVDEACARGMMMRWEKLVADYPAPAWIKKGALVQFKNQENTTKKWQGKLKVLSVSGNLDYCCSRIEWCACVCTAKGSWDNLIRPVNRFESLTPDPSLGGGEKKAKPSHTKKAVKRNDVTTESRNNDKTVAAEKPTFAEQLRRVLLAA